METDMHEHTCIAQGADPEILQGGGARGSTHIIA